MKEATWLYILPSCWRSHILLMGSTFHPGTPIPSIQILSTRISLKRISLKNPMRTLRVVVRTHQPNRAGIWNEALTQRLKYTTTFIFQHNIRPKRDGKNASLNHSFLHIYVIRASSNFLSLKKCLGLIYFRHQRSSSVISIAL